MSRQYPYENLNDEEFESLVICICKEILGIGCKTFSVGKDGAKDSWFTGKAERFPSKSEQWSGNFNIQAKHTKIQNASCSDNDFFTNKSSILNKEIERLIDVMTNAPFDNYIIFTNRKLSGGIHQPIVKMLQSGLKIENVDIIGREQIDSYLNDYSHIVDKFGFSKFNEPLRFYEKDLKDVIIIFSEQIKSISTDTKEYITSFDVIKKEMKNELNNLGKDYFEQIKNHSLHYFNDIEKFIRDPQNDKYMKMYSNTISDLNAIIITERGHFKEFERIIEYLVFRIVENNREKLNDIRSIVRVFLHFMYFNCDIGKTI